MRLNTNTGGVELIGRKRLLTVTEGQAETASKKVNRLTFFAKQRLWCENLVIRWFDVTTNFCCLILFLFENLRTSLFSHPPFWVYLKEEYYIFLTHFLITRLGFLWRIEKWRRPEHSEAIYAEVWSGRYICNVYFPYFENVR